MENSSTKLFEKMYRMLHEIWEQTQDEDLRIYLSDANPLFCDDGKSLDPVVSEDFDKLYNEKQNCGIKDYDFILLYLEKLDSYYGDIKKYFKSIPRDEFDSRKN